LKFWPDIDKEVLLEFADTVPKEWPEQGLWVWKSEQTGVPVTHKRKKIGAVPHDLGVPEGDPFVAVNEPGWQDTNDWKDLNSKFVLMVYRDYVFTGRNDTAFLRRTWPAVQSAIEYLRQFDHGGGVPENGGYPDQTYDDWVTTGVSAYSGGLWLAALRAAEETARALGDVKMAAEYHALFLKGQKTYVSLLWNGEYFRYDTTSESKDDIQADQLAGQWYANLRSRRHCAARHAGFGDEQDFRCQCDEIWQWRNGCSQWHGRGWNDSDQRGGERSLGRNDGGIRRTADERRTER
jgi:non-lysosomal glucosylceramidase